MMGAVGTRHLEPDGVVFFATQLLFQLSPVCRQPVAILLSGRSAQVIKTRDETRLSGVTLLCLYGNASLVSPTERLF